MGRLAISPLSVWVDRIAMSMPAISFAMSASDILDMILLLWGMSNCGTGIAFRTRTEVRAPWRYRCREGSEQLCGVARIDVLGRLLYALRSHLGGIRFA